MTTQIVLFWNVVRIYEYANSTFLRYSNKFLYQIGLVLQIRFPSWLLSIILALLRLPISPLYWDTNIMLCWIMQKMLKYDPAERISAKAAMDHPYFDSLDKSQF
ncbi:hypothetical protein POTOM_052130 [Populus tomentosa]|uniref:Protein kinase domain-containing protein n=1 Tax=Populus tomentosa TaxID=118781 RepID=A0A8X7YBD3_POPTO|nr:hypothetical protein POTOM_052130 [Populus tomentosa]